MTKYFSKLNGYQVKDSEARVSIETLNNSLSALQTNIDENLGKELRKNHIWIFNPYSLSIYFGNESVITKTTESYLTEINKIVEEMREDSSNGNIPKLLIVNTTNGTLLFFHDGYMSNSATTITFNCTGVLSGLGEFVGTNMGLVQDANKQITSITFSKTANYLTTSSNFKFTPYNDYNPVHKKYVDDAIKNLDISESITLDTTPTENSTNGVTSGGVKSYVDGLQKKEVWIQGTLTIPANSESGDVFLEIPSEYSDLTFNNSYIASYWYGYTSTDKNINNLISCSMSNTANGLQIYFILLEENNTSSDKVVNVACLLREI